MCEHELHAGRAELLHLHFSSCRKRPWNEYFDHRELFSLQKLESACYEVELRVGLSTAEAHKQLRVPKVYGNCSTAEPIDNIDLKMGFIISLVGECFSKTFLKLGHSRFCSLRKMQLVELNLCCGAASDFHLFLQFRIIRIGTGKMRVSEGVRYL